MQNRASIRYIFAENYSAPIVVIDRQCAAVGKQRDGSKLN